TGVQAAQAVVDLDLPGLGLSALAVLAQARLSVRRPGWRRGARAGASRRVAARGGGLGAPTSQVSSRDGCSLRARGRVSGENGGAG
ncbi:hypothetical protein, partial [Streptomyces sp. NPDC041003]|uniref:hypothetical protein n=1 Tax=Streptomyces sp. NPDC041003 TaxID=3155730 RepID=UPI00340131BF